MRVHIGTDHAGFDLKNYLVTALVADGHDVVDHGPERYDAEDDYPVYCIPAAEAAVAEPGSLGIVIGGWGQGGPIPANKGVCTSGAPAPENQPATPPPPPKHTNMLSPRARAHTAE